MPPGIGTFLGCRTRLGYGPALGLTFKRPCATLARLVGRSINTVDLICWLIFGLILPHLAIPYFDSPQYFLNSLVNCLYLFVKDNFLWKRESGRLNKKTKRTLFNWSYYCDFERPHIVNKITRYWIESPWENCEDSNQTRFTSRP